MSSAKRIEQASAPTGAAATEGRQTPVVAIVGPPNVGKSTLFNRLARARVAIVHDEPGVTRDRKYADTSAYGKRYTLVDTGGFDLEARDPLKTAVAAQVRSAVTEADVVLFVTDAQRADHSVDRPMLELLRRSGKPVVVAANKADSSEVALQALDLYRAGLADIHAISALHGRGIGELESALVAALPEAPPPAAEDAVSLPRVAFIGRPNAGKSSLLNRILGFERVLVDARPGTTHDAVDVVLERDGARCVLVDTAGIRRKGKVAKEGSAVEALSVSAAVRALEHADTVVVICDALEGVSEQDAKILGLAEERGRGMVVALSKADLLSRAKLAAAEAKAREKLAFAPYVPIVQTSAKTGRGIGELFATLERVRKSSLLRVTTGELNRFFEEAIETRPPPTMGGRAPRIYYVTQAGVAPPTFVAMTNTPDAIHFSYRRFLVNRLRQRFGFEGVPVRVIFKARRRRERRESK
jgi:GTP-binding protein